MGDVVCSLPAAGALKRAFPDCEITWLVDPRFAGIVERCRHVDRAVHVRLTPSPSSWPRLDGRFDAALDLQGLFKSGLAIWRSSAARNLGFHWQREGSWLFSQRVMPDPSSFHVVDQIVDVARAAGGVAHEADFGLAQHPDDLARVAAKLAAAGLEGRFVAMNPCAGWRAKRWLPESFAAVIDGLAEEGVGSVLLGGPSEADREIVREVVSRCGSKPVSMAGETTLEELIALISLSSAHLGGDTGTTHIAAALGKPAIGLYAATPLWRTCPYGQIERCHFDPDSLANICPEPVLETIREALRAETRASTKDEARGGTAEKEPQANR